jgi:hypothetical protein
MSTIVLGNFLCQKKVKRFIVWTVTGAIVQIICRRYIKNHPEFFEEKNGNLKEAEPGIKNKNRNPKFRKFFPRGGMVIQFANRSIEVIVIGKAIMAFLAENGILAGVITGVLDNVPTHAISTYLREASPQTFPELERTRFHLIGTEKDCLYPCDNSLKYLFKILKDTNIPFEEKEIVTRSILTKHLNLKTATGRCNFVLCIVFILYIFSTQNMSSYYIILKNLIKAIKEGKISKVVARAIIKKLERNGVLVDPDLIEIVNS